MNKIIEEFRRIKSLGFIQSTRKSNTGIGKTFEDNLGVSENNIKDPDFDNFEVKSQRFLSSSKITLFTKSPSYPTQANSYLREKYGKPDKFYPEILILHTSFFCTDYNSFLSKYGFKLDVNETNGNINIFVKDLISNIIIDDSIYYSYADIVESTKKLHNLFVVTAKTQVIDQIEYFHYTNAKVFFGFNLNNFYQLVKNGSIQYDLRIGAYKSGRNFGKTHDHGSGFRISRNKMELLYDNVFEIE